jgi:hypothetical protein
VLLIAQIDRIGVDASKALGIALIRHVHPLEAQMREQVTSEAPHRLIDVGHPAGRNLAPFGLEDLLHQLELTEMELEQRKLGEALRLIGAVLAALLSRNKLEARRWKTSQPGSESIPR